RELGELRDLRELGELRKLRELRKLGELRELGKLGKKRYTKILIVPVRVWSISHNKNS
ncbi:MAG: hypothetical protein F6J92_32820, partial [Symploca sp. SIO1A3]|nr:hypothetical protein [Symploca sp. SIO1A3]